MWIKHGKTNDGGCSAPVTALKGDPRYSKVSQLYNIPFIPNICTFYWRENTTILIDLRGSQRLEFITGNNTPSSSSVPIGLRCTPFFSSKLAFLVDLETKGANCILWSNLHNFMTVHIYTYIYTPFACSSTVKCLISGMGIPRMLCLMPLHEGWPLALLLMAVWGDQCHNQRL